MSRSAAFTGPAAFVLLAGLALSAQAPMRPLAAAGVDHVQLLKDLETLSADDMQGREIGTPGGAKARAYVIERFKASGIAPFGQDYSEPFTFSSGRGSAARAGSGTNVVGHIDGEAQPRRYIVVSAHYDHIGVKNGQVFNGADDNASGTAALFAIAKYFSAHPPSNSLLFVAFDGEEAGLLGSRAFVKTPPVNLSTLVVNVNADMIGRDPDDKLFVVGTYTQPFLKPYIERVAARSPVKLLIGHDDPTKRDTEDWTRDSDQYAFMEARVPALYFGVEDYSQHHKPTDDYATITFSFYERAVDTLIDVITEFDTNLSTIEQQSGRR